MCNFKVNDKVVSLFDRRELKRGEIYTVDKVNRCDCGYAAITVKELPAGKWTGYNCRCNELNPVPGNFFGSDLFRRPDYAFADNLLAQYAADYNRKMNDLQDFFNSRK